MSNLVHHDSRTIQPNLDFSSSLASHLIFVDDEAVDAQQRLQEVLLVSPTIDFKVHSFRFKDAVGQISKVLSAAKPESVQSLWIISGSEPLAISDGISTKKRTSILDKRIAQWQFAFAADATCYLLGDNLVDLCNQIERLTTAKARLDFQSATQTLFDEVIFIDHAIQDFEPFVKEILLERDANIVTIDSTVDGLNQIGHYLRGRRGIKAIHLICPGNDTSLVLGQSLLNQDNLKKKYLADLQAIGQSLHDSGEIRIYSKQFNINKRGIDLIRELGGGTGAFVIVANARSQELEFDSDFLTRFSTAATEPAATHEWDDLLPPLHASAASTMESRFVSDSGLVWNSDHSELTIRTQIDRVQAIGWVCCGFAAGGGSVAVWCGLGLW